MWLISILSGLFYSYLINNIFTKFVNINKLYSKYHVYLTRFTKILVLIQLKFERINRNIISKEKNPIALHLYYIKITMNNTSI